MSTGNDGSRDEGELARRAGSVSLGVTLSRITGVVREQTLAYFFPTRLLDSFVAAYTFPNALREMLAEGALSKAFVATFAAVDQNRGMQAADRLFTRVFMVLLPVTLLVSVLGILAAPELVDAVFSRHAFEEPLPEAFRFGFATPRDLAVWLTRLMFPFLCFVSLAALFMGGLQARSSFFLPSVASAFFNLTTIAGATLGYLSAPRLGLHPMAGLAVGVPLGGFAQMTAQAVWFRRRGFRSRTTGGLRATLADASFRRVVRLFLPAAVAAGALQIHVVISRHFASGGASWLSWFHFAYRVAQLPSALVGVALSHAALPSLTRSAGRGDHDGLVRVLGKAGRFMVVLSLAAGAGVFGIAEPLVAVLYLRGEFTPTDAVEVARLLRVFAFGLPAFGATKLLTDGFFSLGTTRPPLAVTLFGTGLTWLITRTLVIGAGLGHLGLPLATVSVAWVSAGLLAVLLTPRLGTDRAGNGRARALYSSVGGAALRGLPAALAAGAAGRFASRLWWAGSDSGAPAALAAVLAGVLAGVLAWGLVIRLTAPREWAPLRSTLGGLGRRLRSKVDR